MKLSLRRRQGQGMTEYIILVALVAIILAVTVYLFRDKIEAVFTSSGDVLEKVNTGINTSQAFGLSSP